MKTKTILTTEKKNTQNARIKQKNKQKFKKKRKNIKQNIIKTNKDR